MSLSGNLKTVSFPDILQLLATGKKTGLLEIRTSTRQKEVAFKDGNIIHASSVNSSEDLLGQMLLNRGKISKKDLERAITLHKQTGRQLGTTLIDMGVFEKAEIADCLKQQIEEIVYNLFSWKEGDFLFHEGVAPQNAPFLVELSTMSVIMEGTRRIDEWIEIQKVLPPDDVLLAVSRAPKTNQEEFTLSVDEFKLIGLINGERTLPDLINLSPMGEFPTCRAIYRLVVNHLIEAVGKREETTAEQEDEEEAILRIVFKLYNNAFYRIRSLFDDVLGGDNTRFSTFAAQYRGGLLNFFPGVDPASDMMPSFEKFIGAVRGIPAPVRFHVLLTQLDNALADQLQFIFELLGVGVYRDGITAVKGEITEPLASKRELVKRYGIEDNFTQAVKRSARVVKMVRG